MPTVSNAPQVPFQFNQNGVPLAGGLLFTYEAGTRTKIPSYTDSTGATPNANPIVLDANGQAAVWLPEGVAYKLVLSPANDTDPPTNPFWTQDNLQSPTNIGGVQASSANIANDSGVANAYAMTLSPAPQALSPGMFVELLHISAGNTAASTLNVNGFGSLPIVGMSNQPLQGSELVTGSSAVFVLNSAGTSWVMVATDGGAFPVATATQSYHALNRATADGRYAQSGAALTVPSLTVTGNESVGGTATLADLTVTGATNLQGTTTVSGAASFTNSAAFSQSPTAPTPTAGDNSTKVATTAFVDAAVGTGVSAGANGLTIGSYKLLMWSQSVSFNGVGQGTVTYPSAFTSSVQAFLVTGGNGNPIQLVVGAIGLSSAQIWANQTAFTESVNCLAYGI